MENILDFNNYNSWMPTIKSIVDKYEIQYLVNKFENYDKYLEKRDVEELIGIDIINHVFDFISKYYNGIVFYHATATNDLNSYLENGLIPMNVERINQYARNIFNEKDFPEITDDIFQKALDKQDTERREGIICFVFDKNESFEEDSSHYLIYGSEYVMHISQHLGKSVNQYPKYLENKLTSTLFKCKISTSDLDDEIIKSISDNILVRYFENIIYPNEKLPVVYINPYLEKRLDSKNIISYEHPTDIKCYIKKVLYGYY